MTPPEATPPFDIKDYRQPLVTSLGVVLGFLVGFLGQWIAEPTFNIHDASDAVLFVGCLGGVALLVTALWRMLSPDAALRTLPGYRRTLTVYMAGVVLPFVSLLVAAFI
ncbi:MAG: hypothetical protein LCH73_15085 [Proteobacteria bacterium]|nr:hypothetical protein [Pseudomonadota bacterium]